MRYIKGMSSEKADKQIRIYGRESKVLKKLLKAKQAEAPQAVIADVIRDFLPKDVDAFLALSLREKAMAIEGVNKISDLVP